MVEVSHDLSIEDRRSRECSRQRGQGQRGARAVCLVCRERRGEQGDAEG